MTAEKLFMKAFKYRIAESTAADAGFLQYAAAAFGQTRFVWNQLKDYIDGLLKQKQRLPSRIDLNNLNFGGNVLTGSPAIADRLRRCPQP